ncbi:DUF6159 family protein [Danxiaibacter flavus]|uniref:DUF6159 family protein n=1 Tax=Danxiaibacter flavus TaxID=3049108 RepID=A0ABV3Z9H1_9BACT|nr:DUF6159 family protein [Chitinophagaceae bacterium DXS]
MNFFTRLSNGWTLAKTSFQVLSNNKQLIAFPILSGISLILLIGSFIGAMFGFGVFGENFFEEQAQNKLFVYGVTFLFYVVNYFVIVFFNMALIHCADLYFKGEQNITVRQGLAFSVSRIGAIFAWALFAGTVGALLKIIQENSGLLGKIITGIIGVVWNVATFFVVPVIAYENVNPVDAVKRSSSIMKEKWGESIAANFSFGLVQFLLILAALAIGFVLAAAIHPIAGIAAGAVLVFLVMAIVSATQTIFISAVYRNINGTLDDHFNQQMIDDLFQKK